MMLLNEENTPITVYSKPQCVQCFAVKRKFTELGLPFREVDITQDSNALEAVLALGYKQAPVTVYGNGEGQHFGGYDVYEIDKLNAAYQEGLDES